MAKHLILSDVELEKGAQAIADDMRVGETRRLKLARIIDDHLDWFDRARFRGLEWTDIIGMLFKAGVTRPDGRPLSRGHLSALVWRKQKSTKTEAHAPAPASNQQAGGPMAGAKPAIAVPSSPVPASGPTRKIESELGGASGKSDERDKVLAYMRRSAQARTSD